MMGIRAKSVATLCGMLLASTAATGQEVQKREDLAKAFKEPPDSARPRTWWHWLNGNITEAGIDKSLDWMKRIGLGGVQNFDASLGTPQIVDKPLSYMTPAWKKAFAHAVDKADALGLEFAISSSPGWSETGGPWVKPADAMKKLVWSQRDVTGGKPVRDSLAVPPGVTGPYGTTPFSDPLAAASGSADDTKRAVPQASGDVAVFAYPLGKTPLPRFEARAQEGTGLDAALLSYNREDTIVTLPKGRSADTPFITARYAEPRTVRSATFFIPDAVPPFGDPQWLPVLEAKQDGAWRRVSRLPLTNVPTTVAFDPVQSDTFRITLRPNDDATRGSLAPPAPGAIAGGVFPSAAPADHIPVATFSLSAESRINRFEAKAGFATVPDYYALDPKFADDSGVAPDRVIDLSDRLRSDGSLDWTPPPGRWRIVRLGWSLLGTTNHPAAPGSTGLEVDKFDGAAVRRYMERYLATYAAAMHPGKEGVDALLTDSIEAGDANWTPKMLAQFEKLRGYDPRPWLPVLTGTVVGSREQSNAFLYDYRRTLADLVASEHYGTIAHIAHARGLTLYGEALEDGRPQLGDDIAMRSHADVPMAAMWAFGKDDAPRPTLIGDALGAASVAHVYGRKLVAAESFTSAFSPWAYAPSDLRHVADLEFALGINRPVIHTSVLSPPDDKLPGLSLAIFGQYFNRHDIWADMARPWIDYLARTSFLLQQGRHVADIAYFFGEEAPLTQLYADGRLDRLPTTHGFDFVDADALSDRLSVRDGRLVAGDDARYRLLYLGGTSDRMTLTTLRRIAALAEAGATVVGAAPTASPSLADDAGQFHALVKRLWPGDSVTMIGKGKVVATSDLDAALDRLGIASDFAIDGAGAAPLVQHRSLGEGGDLYFIDHRANREERVEARFRVTGRVPELWHADTGASQPLSYRIADGRTVVPLTLPPQSSVFVVFRRPTTKNRQVVPPRRMKPLQAVDGPWHMHLKPALGSPSDLTLSALQPLQTRPATRYFSGTATYTTHFTLSEDRERGPLQIDLGDIGDIAEVMVNGKTVGTTWHAPYRLDIGDATRPGDNSLTVKVANLWVNRLIGDAQAGADKRSFAAAPTYRPDAPLRKSGLIGPVRLLRPSGD